jgi:hypothetical protein
MLNFKLNGIDVSVGAPGIVPPPSLLNTISTCTT